jgi:hypothetical protein
MPQLSTHLTVDAPASQVWDVIGTGFARIGDWATSIPASTAIPGAPGSAAAATAAVGSAPVAGRTCTTGAALVPQITETLIAYDEASRTLTYQAGGLPAFIITARSTWTVTPAAEGSCRVAITAHFQARGVLGLLGCWAILTQAQLTARHLEDDLRHYIKHGIPSPRKQRQLSRSMPR